MKKKLPVFELKINVEDEAIVDSIALVEQPAIESDFLAFTKSYAQELFKVNDERMELLGAAMIPDKLIYRVDTQTNEEYNVYFTKETIRQIAQHYFKSGFQKSLNMNHTSVPAKSFIFQSFIVDKAKGINAPKGIEAPEGSWIIGVKCEDPEVWDSIKLGVVKGFSIEGVFQFLDKNMSKIDEDLEVLNILNRINELKDAELKYQNMNIKKDLIGAFKNLLGLYFSKVYTKDELKISDKSIGGKVELVQGDGSLSPAPDGEYVMDDGYAFTIKDGMISSVVGEDPVEVEVESSDSPADVETEVVAEIDTTTGSTKCAIGEPEITEPSVDPAEVESPAEEADPVDVTEMEARLDALESKMNECMDMCKGLMDSMNMEKESASQAIEAFNREVKQLNENILTLAKVPVEFSKTNKKPVIEDSKNDEMLELVRMIGGFNKK